MKYLLALAIFLNGGQAWSASNITVDSALDWFAGSGSNVDTYDSYGDLKLLSTSGMKSDQFEQPFLKYFWTKNRTEINEPAQGKIIIQASGNTNNPSIGHGQGVRNEYFSISTDGEFETSVLPYSNSTGSLYVTGQPWTNYFFAISVRNFDGNNEVRVHFYSETISYVSTPVNLPQNVNSRLRIVKVGDQYSGKYLSGVAGTWSSPVSFTAQINMSPLNYSVGLGAIVPDGSYGGTAEYEYFKAGPYAASGTWESAVMDRGGVTGEGGVISWDASVPSGGGVSIRTRSSEDGVLWSDYSLPYANASGSVISSPARRYLKIQATLTIGSSGDTPVLHSIAVRQPSFEGDFLKPSEVKVVPNPAKGAVVNFQYLLSSPASAVRIEFRGPGGRLLLEDEGGKNLGLNRYVLDSSLMANGVYYVRVRAKPVGSGSEASVTKKFAVLR